MILDQRADLLCFEIPPVASDLLSHFSVLLYILYVFDKPSTTLHLFSSKSIVLHRPVETVQASRHLKLKL